MRYWTQNNRQEYGFQTKQGLLTQQKVTINKTNHKSLESHSITRTVELSPEHKNSVLMGLSQSPKGVRKGSCAQQSPSSDKSHDNKPHSPVLSSILTSNSKSIAPRPAIADIRTITTSEDRAKPPNPHQDFNIQCNVDLEIPVTLSQPT